MITVKPKQSSLLDLYISTSGLTVFLDSFAIKELALHDSARRKRFISAVHRGAEILFSVSNAAELTGPQGGSFLEIRNFMNEIGPHWYPVELDPFMVVQRELQSKCADPNCCFSRNFMNDYLGSRIGSTPKGQPVGISEELFDLGHVMDWLAPQRDSIKRGRQELDQTLIERIKEHSASDEADPSWLDVHFPALPFNPAYPATFAYVNMVRILILESRSYAMMPGDGIDFCQAVIGSAFSSVATLDKKWKRRVEMMSKPNKLARIYYSPELNDMVDDIEAAVLQLAP
jgi:hypothetical protein